MERDDSIGPWSIGKLSLLKKYLEAYVRILSKQPWCKGYKYIDGFAGTGAPISRDEKEYIDGSPRIALSLSIPFTKYHFIEKSNWRKAQLDQLRIQYSKLDIAIYHGDCNKILRDEIIPDLPQNSYKRAIAFLDPFGMQLEWQTIQNIAKIGTIEILLNFPVMAINRNIRLARKDQITSQKRELMDKFWGTKDWEAELFKPDLTLFGIESVRIRQSGKDLGVRFRNRLLEVFDHCTSPMLMANSKNAPLYCLIFSGHNETGVKIVEQIFGKFVKLG